MQQQQQQQQYTMQMTGQIPGQMTGQQVPYTDPYAQGQPFPASTAASYNPAMGGTGSVASMPTSGFSAPAAAPAPGAAGTRVGVASESQLNDKTIAIGEPALPEGDWHLLVWRPPLGSRAVALPTALWPASTAIPPPKHLHCPLRHRHRLWHRPQRLRLRGGH